jgi:septal ring factor EnvC (AmiA/AmiB activator)
MRRMFLVAVLSFLAFWTAFSAAESKAPDTEATIRRLAQQIGEIAGKQRGVLDRLELLKRRVRLDELVLRRIQKDQEDTESALGETEARVKKLKEEEHSARRYLLMRMRQQYALGVMQQYRVYFAANSTQDLRTVGFYLDYLGKRDAESFKNLRDMKTEQEKALGDLDALRARLDQQAEEASKERHNLLAEQSRLAVMLNELGQARQTAQSGLDETLSAAKAMDRYVSDLSFRSRIDLYSKNMAASQGRLPFPCAGKVTKGFGDYIHPRFKTRVPHPGLDIAAPLGAPVKAVFDGQVEFADWLSGFGYTVILSHPGGFFTIYGHLDQVMTAKGTTVSQGQIIGLVGESAASATTALYFELRQGGKALDPAGWLKGASHGVDSQDR